MSWRHEAKIASRIVSPIFTSHSPLPAFFPPSQLVCAHGYYAGWVICAGFHVTNKVCLFLVTRPRLRRSVILIGACPGTSCVDTIDARLLMYPDKDLRLREEGERKETGVPGEKPRRPTLRDCAGDELAAFGSLPIFCVLGWVRDIHPA